VGMHCQISPGKKKRMPSNKKALRVFIKAS
jgi:hypothetical protein